MISFVLTLECANKTLCQNYTVIYCRLHRYGTALPEEQLGQHEILRAPHVCGRALRMTSFLLAGGFAPCTPIRDCEHSCLTIIVQFGILFFHIQVCQQSAAAKLRFLSFVNIHPRIRSLSVASGGAEVFPSVALVKGVVIRQKI